MSDSAGILESVRDLLDEYADELAALIIEPLQRVVPPRPGFLAALREECTHRSIVLIFDEIFIRSRIACGGPQEA